MNSALIIEDDDGVIMALSAVLNGYAKKAARTMTEAIAMLQKHEFDVVFLDLHLPDSDCDRTMEMLPMLRRLANDSAFILMSGYHSKIGNAKYAVDSVLYKPFNSEHIREALMDAKLAQTRGHCVTDETAKMCRAILAFI